MKKLLLISALFITLFSCSKEEVSDRQDPQVSVNGSIEYKVNGTLTVMDNVSYLGAQYVLFEKQLKGSILNETRYMLNAQNGGNNLIAFPIVTDSLQQISYHYDHAAVRGNSTFAFYFTATNAAQAGLFSMGDYFDISITSYKNSRITGTFTAKYTPLIAGGFGTPGSVLITEGKINNVMVIY